MSQHMRFLSALLASVFVTLAIPLSGQNPESLPDIDVLYIERTPRYPGYRPDTNKMGKRNLVVDG